MVIPVRIQGIHDAVRVRIQEFHHHAIIRRHPLPLIAIIVPHRHNLAYFKAQEIVHPHSNWLFKPYPLGAIYAELRTIGIGGGGGQDGRHRIWGSEFGGARVDGAQFMDVITLFIHQISRVVSGKNHTARADAKLIHDLCALVGDSGFRVAVKNNSGGCWIFRNHLNGRGYGNIVPGHINLPLCGEHPILFIDNGISRPTFHGDGEPTNSIGECGAIFRMPVYGDGDI